jgi:hypothetical protein
MRTREELKEALLTHTRRSRGADEPWLKKRLEDKKRLEENNRAFYIMDIERSIRACMEALEALRDENEMTEGEREKRLDDAAFNAVVAQIEALMEPLSYRDREAVHLTLELHDLERQLKSM